MVNTLICRTCLRQKLRNHCKSISPEEETEETSSILEMLNYCVPELDIYLVINPVICNDCIKLLEAAFKFKTECLKNEEKFLKYSHSVNNAKVNLNYFFKKVHLLNPKESATIDEETENIQVVKIELDVEEGNLENTFTSTELERDSFTTPQFDCEKCFGCENKFREPYYHSKNYVGPYICHNCGKKVDDIIDLRKHMMNHRRQRRCKVCNKFFRDLHNLTTHLRTHTGSKPFSCTICTKSFREKYKLDQHIKQHNKDNTVKCKFCGKVLSTTYNLKIHMKMHAKKPNCELCGEIFNCKSDLIRHLETDSETCGNFVKSEITPVQIEEPLVKTEPEFFEKVDLQKLCKEEDDGDTAEEIDIMT